MDYKIIVIGTSAGGMDALKKILPLFPPAFPVPIVIVQHVSSQSNGFMIQYLNSISSIRVKEAEEKKQQTPEEMANLIKAAIRKSKVVPKKKRK